MLTQTVSFLSRQEYLEHERSTEFRSEYHDGQIFAMVGASRNHNRIVTNISSSLNVQLKSRLCNNYSNDMRIGIQGGKRYVYPDIVVTCGKEEFEDENHDTLLNPVVIIEILSATTEAYDRGTKFLYYQTISSLQEYVLVSQEKRCFEIYRKQADGSWLYRALQSSPIELELQSIACMLTADEVYAKVEEENAR
jgi:Uma2 family endonuclease